MTRVAHIEPDFVEFIPDDLDDGVLYVSIKYAVAVHNCCCGCHERVVTPLSPAQWRFTYDGERISLDPSVGNGALSCNSHYTITGNRPRWARPLTATETTASIRRDQTLARDYHQAASTSASAPAGRWARLWRRLVRR